MNTISKMLKRLEKNGSSVFRRPFLMFLLCALLIFALALGLLESLGKTNQAGVTMQYELPAQAVEDTNPPLRGIGIDLSMIESPNLLRNPDFAPLLYREAIPISSIEEHQVISSFSAAKSYLYADHFFDQARLRFARINSGSMTELGGGLVESHKALVLGQSRAVKLARQEPGIINDIAWRAKADGSFRDVIAVGDNGHALGQLLSSNPDTLELGTRNKLVAVFGDALGYVVLDELGGLYISDTEAKIWKELPLKPAPSNWRATDLVRINDQIIVCGTLGRLLIVKGLQSEWLQLTTSTKFNAIALHDEKVILAGDSNQIWQSEALPLFRRIELPEYEPDKPNWMQLLSREGTLLLSGSKAALLSGTDIEHMNPLDTNFPEAGEPAFNVIMLSHKDFIVQIPDRVSYRTDNGGSSFQTFETPIMSTGKLFSAAPDRFIGVSALSQLTIFPLEAHFALAQDVNTLKLEPGDMMYLEQVSYRQEPAAEITVADWTSPNPLQPLLLQSAGIYVYYPVNSPPGSTTGIDTSLLDSSEYLLLLEDGSLKQGLDSARLQEGLVYTVAITAHIPDDKVKADGGIDTALSFVLSGPFPEQRLRITGWSNEPHEQEVKFVMPRLTGKSSQTSLISLEVEGALAVDQICFCPVKDRGESLSTAQNEQLQAAAPGQIRFSSLSLGSQTLREGQWIDHSEQPIPAVSQATAQASGAAATPAPAVLSMAEAMRLTRALKAQPWINIEAHTSAAEMLDLIAYLAGSLDEPLGQLRLEQGSATPWTSGFDRVYLEFKDDTDVYKTAEDKAAFADYMKSVVESSPQYTQIKNKLVFVDGMDYAGARMLSTADFHSLDFPVSGTQMPQISSFAGIQKLYEGYRLAAPRQMESGSDAPQELMRRLQRSEINLTLTPAEELYMLLYDYGEGTALINIDPDFSRNKALFELSRLNEGSRRLGLMETDELQVLSFSDGQNPTIFVWSAAPTRASIRLNTGAAQDQLKISYYDRNLQLQSTGAYPGDDREISLLPGMLVIVK